MPDAKELAKVPRQWLANVIYSVVGQPFGDWVDEVIQSRNSKIVASDNKCIAMDPEVYAAFQSSTQVSSKYFVLVLFYLRFCVAVNGRGVDMLKVGTKRRRTKAELEDFKLEQMQKEDDDRDIRRRLALLEQQLTEER